MSEESKRVLISLIADAACCGWGCEECHEKTGTESGDCPRDWYDEGEMAEAVISLARYFNGFGGKTLKDCDADQIFAEIFGDK